MTDFLIIWFVVMVVVATLFGRLAALNHPKPEHRPFKFDTNARRNLHLAMDPHRQDRKTG